MEKDDLNKNLILIDKPKGLTSFDVIRVLRKKLGVIKMGHSGTLDPLATGLMIVGVGDGTKKLKELIKLPKTYEAQIFLGIMTETGDMEGRIIEKTAVHNLELHKVKEALESIKGKLRLRVPVYSAVKVGGRSLYKSTRRGEQVVPPEKEMEVYRVEYEDCFRDGDYYVLKALLEVRSGTYIRSIAEEIGRRLGLPATVKELRRLSIGDFSVKDAEKLVQFSYQVKC